LKETGRAASNISPRHRRQLRRPHLRNARGVDTHPLLAFLVAETAWVATEAARLGLAPLLRKMAAHAPIDIHKLVATEPEILAAVDEMAAIFEAVRAGG
jgi:hypothetical protein